jgi:hypothetical protein
MKKLCLLLMLQCAVFTLFAQQPATRPNMPEPVNTMKDKQEYQGYTIRLMPALPTPQSIGSYGFDILKDNKPLVHQFQSPLLSPKGLQKKDDAYKVAQWMIKEYNKTGHWQTMVPPHIANELKIETN